MIRRLRTFTAALVLLSEAAIGQVAGQAPMMANLYAGIRRYHVLGLVWFDVAQQGGPARQDWRLEGHRPPPPRSGTTSPCCCTSEPGRPGPVTASGGAGFQMRYDAPGNPPPRPQARQGPP